MSSPSDQTHYDVCPICSSAMRTWRVKPVNEHQYNIDRCHECGFVFVNPRPSLDFLMAFYATFGHDHSLEGKNSLPTLESVIEQERVFPNATLDAQRIVRTLDRCIPDQSKGTFFDIGNGYGFFSKAAQDAGYEVITLDLAKIEREISEQMTGIVPHSCSFEEFEYEPESLQVILMSQILEHAMDVNEWLSKSYQLLKPGGMIVIALPNFGSLTRKLLQEKDPFVCPPAHLNYFSPKSLTALLNKHGFDVREMHWVSRMPTQSIQRRLPKVGRPLLPLVKLAANATFKMMDLTHHGMIINAFGQKPAA